MIFCPCGYRTAKGRIIGYRDFRNLMNYLNEVFLQKLIFFSCLVENDAFPNGVAEHAYRSDHR